MTAMELDKICDTLYFPRIREWWEQNYLISDRVLQIRIVGTSFFPQGNGSVCDHLSLWHHKDNEYDKNAILVSKGDIPIGYLERVRTHWVHAIRPRLSQVPQWDNKPKILTAGGTVGRDNDGLFIYLTDYL